MRIGVICILALLPIVHFRVVASDILRQYGLTNAPLTHWLRKRSAESDETRKNFEKALRHVESVLKRANCKKDKSGAPYSEFGRAVYSDADWMRYASTGARALGLKIDNTACAREYMSRTVSPVFYFISGSMFFAQGLIVSPKIRLNELKPNCQTSGFSAIRSAKHGTSRWYISLSMHPYGLDQLRFLPRDDIKKIGNNFDLVEFLHFTPGSESRLPLLSKPLRFKSVLWGTHEQVMNATSLLNIYSNESQRRFPVSNALIAKGAALKSAYEELMEIRSKYNHAVDTLWPSNLAILCLPVVLALFPFVLVQKSPSRLILFFNILLTDVLPVVPLAIEGIHLLNLPRSTVNTLHVRTVGDIGPFSSSDALADISIATCQFSISSGSGFILLLTSVFAMVAGITIELITVCVVSRQKRKKIELNQSGNTACQKCLCDTYSEFMKAPLLNKQTFVQDGAPPCKPTIDVKRWPILGSLLVGGNRSSG